MTHLPVSSYTSFSHSTTSRAHLRTQHLVPDLLTLIVLTEMRGRYVKRCVRDVFSQDEKQGAFEKMGSEDDLEKKRMVEPLHLAHSPCRSWWQAR